MSSSVILDGFLLSSQKQVNLSPRISFCLVIRGVGVHVELTATGILTSPELKNWDEDNKLQWYLLYNLRGDKLIERIDF